MKVEEDGEEDGTLSDEAQRLLHRGWLEAFFSSPGQNISQFSRKVAAGQMEYSKLWKSFLFNSTTQFVSNSFYFGTEMIPGSPQFDFSSQNVLRGVL